MEKNFWDFKNGMSLSNEDLQRTIRIVSKEHDTLQTAINECKRTQIADYVINMDKAKVRLGELAKDVSYYKELSNV
jgi:hypothetical protein